MLFLQIKPDVFNFSNGCCPSLHRLCALATLSTPSPLLTCTIPLTQHTTQPGLAPLWIIQPSKAHTTVYASAAVAYLSSGLTLFAATASVAFCMQMHEFESSPHRDDLPKVIHDLPSISHQSDLALIGRKLTFWFAEYNSLSKNYIKYLIFHSIKLKMFLLFVPDGLPDCDMEWGGRIVFLSIQLDVHL